MKRLEYKNQQLQGLIQELKKKAIEADVNLFKRLASELEGPTRTRRVVNLSKISQVTKEGDMVVVPGKVLSSGDLDHKLTIVAYQFSSSALTKIRDAKARALGLPELLKENIKGKRIQIIG